MHLFYMHILYISMCLISLSHLQVDKMVKYIFIYNFYHIGNGKINTDSLPPAGFRIEIHFIFSLVI